MKKTVVKMFSLAVLGVVAMNGVNAYAQDTDPFACLAAAVEQCMSSGDTSNLETCLQDAFTVCFSQE